MHTIISPFCNYSFCFFVLCLLGTQNNGENNKGKVDKVCNYSWGGQTKMPSYVNKLVFPEICMTTLRTIVMQEDELFKFS